MDKAEWKAMSAWRRLLHPRGLAAIAGAGLVGAAAGAAGRAFWIRPQLRVDRLRYESTLDVARLYALQLSYKKAHGVYANDLDALLAAAPDRAKLKARLAANTDMTTLAVVGDARKFKVELNVLDGERTAIRVQGPIQPRLPAAAPALMPEAPAAGSPDGAPLAPAR